MLKASIALMGLLLVSVGPSRSPPPEAYLDPVDRARAVEEQAWERTGIYPQGALSPCMIELPGRPGIYTWKPIDQCVRMEPPKRWQGIWRNDFEGSRFCPAPATTCPQVRYTDEMIWLTERPDERGNGKSYRVEFIGRRNIDPGMYGHGGMFAYEILVDRMISQVEIPREK